MADVKTLVDTKIAGKRVMIFSKSWCSYCARAKQTFQEYLGKELSPEDYEVLEIENQANCEAIQDYLKQLTGARSVPRVFINGKCIGGGDDTAAAHRGGRLRQMLTA